MRGKGFATSAILYTMLLLFLVLMVGILNNLQYKKTIMDALKNDTIQALEGNTITDAILDQIAVINNKIVELEAKITEAQNNHQFTTKVYTLSASDTILTMSVTYNDMIVIIDHTMNNKTTGAAWESFELGTIENWEYGGYETLLIPRSSSAPNCFLIVSNEGKVTFNYSGATGPTASTWYVGQKVLKRV